MQSHPACRVQFYWTKKWNLHPEGTILCVIKSSKCHLISYLSWCRHLATFTSLSAAVDSGCISAASSRVCSELCNLVTPRNWPEGDSQRGTYRDRERRAATKTMLLWRLSQPCTDSEDPVRAFHVYQDEPNAYEIWNRRTSSVPCVVFWERITALDASHRTQLCKGCKRRCSSPQQRSRWLLRTHNGGWTEVVGINGLGGWK